MRRRRRPTTVVWILAAPFAILIGLAIGGLPSTAEDVPLDARNVPTTTTPETATTVVAVTTTATP